jgi:hypothetical protein
MRTLLPTLLIGLLVTGCTDVEDGHDHDHDHDHEVMTTIILNFTDDAAGTTESFEWADPEDDGDPVIDAILLTDGSSYTVDVEIWNELEDPAEDVTPEITDEAEEHQTFFTGSAVVGPATGTNAEAIVEHSYADEDENLLPVGLVNSIVTLGTGSGDLTFTLRHMPEENGSAVKVDGLAADVASGGFGAIGGANDIQVTFDLTVQ